MHKEYLNQFCSHYCQILLVLLISFIAVFNNKWALTHLCVTDTYFRVAKTCVVVLL